jgi:phosphoglycerate dehydrogenase-like enzyme
MKKIIVSFKVNEEQKQLLKSTFEIAAQINFLKDFDEGKYQNLLENADILFAWNPGRELKNIKDGALKNLKFVQLLSAGYDHVDFNMFSKDCKIASNKGAYAEPMAEHTAAMILAFYKNLYENHKKLSIGEFNQRGINRSLKDSTCGILGFGEIGKATAKLFRAFGTKIYAINTSGKTEEEVEFIGTLKDLEYVLKNSDIITISLSLNSETQELINKKNLELMKKDAVLINVARGGIISEMDLYNHLKTHPEFSAGIDAWWMEPFTEGEFKTNYPFFELPNLLGSPHNSAIVPGIIFRATKKAAENILKFIEKNKAEIIDKNGL